MKTLNLKSQTWLLGTLIFINVAFNNVQANKAHYALAAVAGVTEGVVCHLAETRYLPDNWHWFLRGAASWIGLSTIKQACVCMLYEKDTLLQAMLSPLMDPSTITPEVKHVATVLHIETGCSWISYIACKIIAYRMRKNEQRTDTPQPYPAGITFVR